MFDDFREAYAWLRHNTEVDDKVSFLRVYLCCLFDFLEPFFPSFNNGLELELFVDFVHTSLFVAISLKRE